MHVSVDATRERQKILGVEHLLGLLCRDIGDKARDLSILDRDVETIDRRLVGAHHSRVLDHKVVELFHSRVFSLPTLPPCADLSASRFGRCEPSASSSLRRHRRVPLFLPEGLAEASYRLPSASISCVPISSLRSVKSSMRERNGSEVPPAASEGEESLARPRTAPTRPAGKISSAKPIDSSSAADSTGVFPPSTIFAMSGTPPSAGGMRLSSARVLGASTNSTSAPASR